MIGSTRRFSVFAYARPADLRKGFDGLFALVKRELQRDPLSGDVFLFTSRTRKRAKLLYWDGTGLCVFAKRIERGCVAALWREQLQQARARFFGDKREKRPGGKQTGHGPREQKHLEIVPRVHALDVADKLYPKCLGGGARLKGARQHESVCAER
ncbi:MAG: IS66 family insertion sequence element accessory protein TnpB [Deltaproteobacteria bacterium]|nr:IS66 family insertion sequence element accessory protein TnpB [Deltaproteobacteria bacterium]